ncbi:hypothetical protein AYO37_00945 [Opitutia bacterium SCGC AG-212-L18]|nr:hypothetical protein AYO37_00945 [Opitutae bacterium SCGC AG-212-L18]
MEFPIGIDDFKELAEGDYYMVDKSLFIKEIVKEGSKVILITRPRRFGKTLNLSMLYYFLRKNHSGKNIFEGLNIAEDTEFCKMHQGQYPVIFISFKDVKKDDYEAAYDAIADLIRKLYEEHRYLLEGNTLFDSEKNIYMSIIDQRARESHLVGAIAALSGYMKKKFDRKAIILIDEYDTPIQQAYLKEYYDDMITLMRGIFGTALKGNDGLDKAIVTGITRVAQESLFSGVNNFECYSMLQETYGQYFGFTEEEVLKLMKESGTAVSIKGIKTWYNGYKIGPYTLYNPWSIVNCLKNKGKLKTYWLYTSSNGLISELLAEAYPVVKRQLEELLQKKKLELALSENLVFSNIKVQEEALWTLLLYAGYLKVLSTRLKGRRLMAKVAIPNKEVEFVYEEIVENWFSEKLGLSFYDEFLASLINGKIDRFKKYLTDYLMQTGSYFDFNKSDPERVFHIFILGLVVGLKDEYVIQSNREAGLGRVDVTLIPNDKKKKGIILEFKVSESAPLLKEKANEALTQIKEKKYVEIFRQHSIKKVLAIGMAFCGKDMELASEDILIK